MQIEQLPDFPALQQLARALWRQGTARGAAVLVGAGFSKFAELAASDTPEPPIWSEFAQAMAARLYPNDPKRAPVDPLRLAEEYRIYFGQAVLDEFIRTRIRDAAWRPGTLHRSLVGLGWTDVLTTNWDTLLERAANLDANPRYDFVLCEADLAHAHAPGTVRNPRIVKLHGSIGTTEHFIVAEEDYRTYPMRFAAFVNLARQIFIENELCLLGFSGDDPNFLQWSGWVRDNLSDNARRIYLVGALDLGSPKRKFLEARNIAPIDLAPLAQDGTTSERHKVATRLFLEFLIRARPKPPHDWRPTPTFEYQFLPKTLEDHQRQRQDKSYAASLLDEAAKIWRVDRETYPGWLVCPPRGQSDLRFGTNICPTDQSTLDMLPAGRRAEVLYEIAWRHIVAHWPLDAQTTKALSEIADPAKANDLTKLQCLEIAVLLLRTARREDDDSAFTKWSGIIEAESEPLTDIRGEVAYQKALRARDQLNYSAAKVEAADISGPDPVWRLKRAALLAEIGEVAEAAELVNAAVADLDQRQRSDPTSVWTRSRRAWAERFARGVRRDRLLGGDDRPWPSEFKEAHCDPEDAINWIENEVAEAIRTQRDDALPTLPLFEAGHYRDQSDSIRLQSASHVMGITALDILMETAGVPMRLHHVTFVSAAARDSVIATYETSVRWYVWLLRVLGDPLNRQFERYFGRIAISQLPPHVALTLSQMATTAISYWKMRASKARTSDGGEFTFAVGRLRLWIEVLARLTVHQVLAVARTTLELAIELAKDQSIMHPWLYDPLAHLVKYSVQAIPPADRATLVLLMLEFPLSKDLGDHPFHWPEPTEPLQTTSPNRPRGDTRWDQCVAKLIETARPGSNQRAEAVVRLAYLARHGALSNDEATAFGRELWAEREELSGLPSETSLLAWAYTILPAPKEIDKEDILRTYLFDCDIKQLTIPPIPLGTLEVGKRVNHLIAIAAAAQGPLRPTRHQAAKLFDDIVSWRPLDIEAQDPMSAGIQRPLHNAAKHYLGEVLRNVVVPSLAWEDRTHDRLQALLSLIRDVPVGIAAGALPYFVNDDVMLHEAVVQGIHQAIAGRSDEEVIGGTTAVEAWAVLASTRPNMMLPPQLTERVISAMESRRETGLHGILHCVRKLISVNILSEPELRRVANVLEGFLIEWDYRRIDPDSQQAVSASLIRAECVRLAHAMGDAGRSDECTRNWLRAEVTDPLPEVRFAMATND